MNRYDVAIVGGGPIGGHIAAKIAKRGFKTALFEEHKKVGEPIHCAGLVSPKIFDFIDIDEKKIVQNKIHGANIHSPSGELLKIGGEKVHAIVIDRTKLDINIVNNAKIDGANIFLGRKIISGEKKKDNVELKLEKDKGLEKTQSKLVIGADGSRSPVRNIFKFPQPTELLHSIGAEVINTDLDPKFVEIYLGKKFAPGFFAWIIPINSIGTEARIGLCVDNNSKKLLKTCFANLLRTKELEDAAVIKKIGGTIPLGPLKETVSSKVMLVGDAAAQVKPTSGGGIFLGLLCANHCASVAIEALEKNDFSKRMLNKYHKQWNKELGRELSLGMRFRNFYRNLDDEKIDKILNVLNNEKSINVIEKNGDIDFPSKLAFPLLKSTPSLLKFLPSVFKSRKSNYYFEEGGGGT